MPTDQKLDDAAEERNRKLSEKLYSTLCQGGEGHRTMKWSGVSAVDCPACREAAFRAAIRADREGGVDRLIGSMPQAAKLADEIAFADRLAEALDGLIVGEPTCTPDDACFNECRANWSERLEVARAVLREHEERRR